MKRMRALTQELVEGNNSHSDKPVERKVACLSLSEDQSYFDSYAHFGIHLEMLSVSCLLKVVITLLSVLQLISDFITHI